MRGGGAGRGSGGAGRAEPCHVFDKLLRPAPPESAGQMSPEQTIAHYRIIGKLGEGGMGTVYRATDTKLNRDVAIKMLPPAFAEDASRMQRFEREAQVLAANDGKEATQTSLRPD